MCIWQNLCVYLMDARAFSVRTNKASKQKNNAWLKEIYAVLIVNKFI